MIDICLPTYLNAPYALKAMEKVKYVFVEKPVALTVAEGKALIEQSEKTGCNVQVGQVIRFWDEYVELKKIVESSSYGKVVNASFRRLSPRPTWGWNDWLLDATLSGGAAQDLHIHDVDYVLSLFGKPDTFHAVKNTIGEKNSYANVLMQFEDFAVSVEGTWDLPETHPFQAEFRVVFENAVVELSGGKFMKYTNEGAEEIAIEKAEVIGDGFEGGNISDLGGYYNELVYFCDKAAKGEKVENATVYDGVSSLEFLLEEIKDNA